MKVTQFKHDNDLFHERNWIQKVNLMHAKTPRSLPKNFDDLFQLMTSCHGNGCNTGVK